MGFNDHAYIVEWDTRCNKHGLPNPPAWRVWQPWREPFLLRGLFRTPKAAQAMADKLNKNNLS